MSTLPLPAQQILQQCLVEAQSCIHGHIVNSRLGALGGEVLAKFRQGSKIVATNPFRIDGQLVRGLDVSELDRAFKWKRSFGFVETAEEPIAKEGWETASDAWVLMLKPMA